MQAITSIFCMIVCLYVITGINLDKNISTVYTVWCSVDDYDQQKEANAFDCKGQLIPVKKEYRINKDTNEVISKRFLTIYKNCIIFDKKNWGCNGDDYIYDMLVKNGRYIRTLGEGESTRASTRLEYTTRIVTGMIKGMFGVQ